MNRQQHDKRVAELYARLSEAYDGDRHWTAAEVRDLIDDALADAYGSGEKDELDAALFYLDFIGKNPDSPADSIVKRTAAALADDLRKHAHHKPDAIHQAQLARLRRQTEPPS